MEQEPASAMKLVTINIRFEPESWLERRDLLADGLAAEQPDCILAHEVWEEARDWLSGRLALPQVYWLPYHKPSKRPDHQAGIALFSRHPLLRREMLVLSEGHGWLAQRAEIALSGKPFVVCNGHYYWHPGPHEERDRQVQRMLDWMGSLPDTLPTVVGGDFNGTPETSALEAMRRYFTSAYAAHNGEEPRFTCPTPLSPHWANPWRGTLDYLFVNRSVRVLDCRLILERPSPHNPTVIHPIILASRRS